MGESPMLMKVALIDTETTGLGQLDVPISIGVIVVEVDSRGAILSRHGEYYGTEEPDVAIHPKAAAIHGLTMAQLRGTKFDRRRLGELLGAASVAIAHNVNFDARMVSKVYPFNGQWRCSLKQFPWTDTAGRKLDDVCEALQVERRQPHNALSDCEALLACLSVRTGKTERSKTYLGKLLAKNPFLIQERPESSGTGTWQGEEQGIHIRVSLADPMAPPSPATRNLPHKPSSEEGASLLAILLKVIVAIVTALGVLLQPRKRGK